MITRVIEGVLDSGVAEVVVVLGHEADRVTELLSDYPIQLVYNAHHLEGMGTSIRTGVGAASHKATGYMICLSDLPFIEKRTYRSLVDAFNEMYQEDGQVITIPVCGGRRGHPVIFSSAYRPQMLACSGDEGARKIVRAHGNHVRLYKVHTRNILQDLDTLEAYRNAESSDDSNSK